MKQSDKCGNVRHDDKFNLHLGSGAGPWVSGFMPDAFILSAFFSCNKKQSVA